MPYILFAEYVTFEASMGKEKLSPVLFLSTSAAGVIRLYRDITVSPAAQVLINGSGRVSTFIHDLRSNRRTSDTFVAFFHIIFKTLYSIFLINMDLFSLFLKNFVILYI